MKALVTGASGFIGSTLIQELLQLGFEVKALLRKTSSTRYLDGLKYERAEGDVCDIESLKRAVADVDYVYHLAGTVAARDKTEYFRHNAEGTANLARAVAEARPGLSRFVYVSSIAAGGPAAGRTPRRESEESRPVSAYGESKLAGEKELLKHKNTYPISIVRPPIVYGPRDKGVFVFIRTVARNLMPILPGAPEDGQKYYSAVYVTDLTRGIVQAGLAPVAQVPSGEIFYISGDGVFTYEEMMKTIAEKLERAPLRLRVPGFALKAAAAGCTVVGKVTRKNLPLNLDKLNELTPNYWICSNEKAKSMLGFSPEYDLSRGMSDAIDWYKKERWI